MSHESESDKDVLLHDVDIEAPALEKLEVTKGHPTFDRSKYFIESDDEDAEAEAEAESESGEYIRGNSHRIRDPVEEMTRDYVQHASTRRFTVPKKVSESSNDSDLDSGKVHVKFRNLNEKQKNQLKKIKRMIKGSRAYSLHYYKNSTWWKYVNWIGSAFNILLSGMNALIGIFFPNCSQDTFVNNYNTLLGTIVTLSIAFIALLSGGVRQRDNQDAGDKYNQLSTELMREVFFSNTPVDEMDLEHMIEKYSIMLDNYMEMYTEPPPEKIGKILQSKTYEIAIQFKH